MASNHVSGDFGRRECCSNKWHNGVDVTAAPGAQDLGYHILSLNAGTVHYIHANNYKILAIDGAGDEDFGYGHIFASGAINTGNPEMRTGDMVMKHLDAPHDNFVVIIYDPATATDRYAITNAPIPASPTAHTYSVTHNGTTYDFANSNISNTVDAGQVIAPLGGSGGFGGNEHIHLYNFDVLNANYPATHNNTKDPLFFVDHVDPTYAVDIPVLMNDYSNANAGAPHNWNFRVDVNITNTTSNTNSQYNPGSGISDLNDVKLFIKKDYEPVGSYALIQGAYFDSKISEGARHTAPGNERYPADGNPVNNTSGGDASNGADNTSLTAGVGVDLSQRKRDTNPNHYASSAVSTSTSFGRYHNTGIYGGAFTGAAAAAEDKYYLNDFPTRIHWLDNYGRDNAMIANFNQEARYGDGRYNYYARATDIFLQTTNSTPGTFVIDNFRPYIVNVEIREDNSGGTYVYNGNWGLNGAALVPNSTTFTDASYSSDVWMKFTTSEPMNTLTLQVMGNTYTPTAVANSNNMLWELTIPQADNVIGTHTLSLEGTDYSGHQLETDPANVPIRQAGVNVWTPTPSPGPDVLHSFTIATNLAVNFAASGTSGSAPMAASFVDFSTGTITAWQWSVTPANGWMFTGGTNASSQDINLTFLTPNTYQVTLNIIDNAGNTATQTETITVGYTIMAAISATPPTGTSPLSVAFSSASTNGSPTSYTWDFGDPGSGALNTSTDPNPNHVYQNDGSYLVTLVAEDAQNSSTATTTVVAAPPLSAVISASTSAGNAPLSVQFNSSASQGNITSYHWDFGDPAAGALNNSTAPHPTFVYVFDGVYTVTLTIGNGIDTETATTTITVSGQTLVFDFCTATPYNPLIGQSVTFDAGISGGTPPYTYTFDFDGGTATPTPSIATYVVEYFTYNSAGVKAWNITVEDYVGDIVSCGSTATVEAPIEANFSMTSGSGNNVADGDIIAPGQTITFEDISTGGTGTFDSWHWIFTDMTFGSVNATEHAPAELITGAGPGNPAAPISFPDEGMFMITMAVQDANTGVTGTVVKTIRVAQPEQCLQIYINGPRYVGLGKDEFYQLDHNPQSCPDIITDQCEPEASCVLPVMPFSISHAQWRIGIEQSGIFDVIECVQDVGTGVYLSFNEVDNHNLRANAWNACVEGTDPMMWSSDPANFSHFDRYSTVVTCIDCADAWYFCGFWMDEFAQSTSHDINDPFRYGTIIVGEDCGWGNSVINGDPILQADEGNHLQAFREVIIKDGTDLLQGCNFSARLYKDVCDETSSVCNLRASYTNHTLIKDEKWSGKTYVVEGELKIPAGKTLTLSTSNIEFTSGAKIVVDPGGKLVVENSSLRGCSDCTFWEGIEVRGHADRDQLSTNQGVVTVLNSTITNAKTAIYAGKIDEATGVKDPDGAGGIVKVSNTSKFLDNGIDIEFDRYEIEKTQSYVRESTFGNNEGCTKVYYKDMEQSHIRVNGLRGLEVSDNSLEGKEIGIKLDESKDFTVIGNTFNEVKTAIATSNTTAGIASHIEDNTFLLGKRAITMSNDDHSTLDIGCNQFLDFGEYAITGDALALKDQGSPGAGAGNEFNTPSSLHNKYLEVTGVQTHYYYDPQYAAALGSPGAMSAVTAQSLKDNSCYAPKKWNEEAVDGTFSDVQVVPNPNRGQFKLHFYANEGQKSTLRLVDLTGKLMFEQQALAYTGNNVVDLTLPKLAKGVYFLEVVTATTVYLEKVVLQ